MKIRNNLSIFAAIALVGCAPTQEEIAVQKVKNNESVNNPQFVAETPRGKLYVVFVQPYANSENITDRIYFFENDTNVTVNSEYRAGKRFNTQAILMINGVEYVQKNQK